MCCMFEKEIGNLEDNEETEDNEKMINQGIDVSLVKIIKKRRNHQDDPDLNDDDKLIINQQYQNLHASEKDFILFELLRDCGDVTTVAKVLDFLVNECHQEPDKLKVQQEIIRPLYQKPELKAWLIKELKNDGKVGQKTRGIDLNFNNACNLRCKYCFTNSPKGDHVKDFLDYFEYITFSSFYALSICA